MNKVNQLLVLLCLYQDKDLDNLSKMMTQKAIDITIDRLLDKGLITKPRFIISLTLAGKAVVRDSLKLLDVEQLN